MPENGLNTARKQARSAGREPDPIVVWAGLRLPMEKTPLRSFFAD